MANTPPCHKCPDRFVGCHITCEKYAEYAEQRGEVRKKQRDMYDFGKRPQIERAIDIKRKTNKHQSIPNCVFKCHKK